MNGDWFWIAIYMVVTTIWIAKLEHEVLDLEIAVSDIKRKHKADG